MLTRVQLDLKSNQTRVSIKENQPKGQFLIINY